MNTQVWIRGVGVETASGSGLAALRDDLAAGRHHLARLSIAEGLPHELGARLADEGAARGFAQSARALEAALAAMPSLDRARTGLFLGSGLGPREPAETGASGVAAHAHGLTEALAQRFGLGGERATFSVTCASGLCALEAARMALLSGRVAAAVVVGCETLSRTIQGGFCALEALSRTASPEQPCAQDGIVLGEGACALLLTTEQGAGSLALEGVALAADATHVTSPDLEGRGIARATARALREAGRSPESIEWIALSAPASPAYAAAYEAALTPLFGADWQARAECWEPAVGHLLAASGTLGVAWGAERGSTLGLSLTVGFGGLSGATIVSGS